MGRYRAIPTTDRGGTLGLYNPSAKLTDHDIKLMTELRADGMPARVIAEKFEVCIQTVYNVTTGKTRAVEPDHWVYTDAKGIKRRLG